MGISITRFGGMMPRRAAQLLPEGFATEAINCDIASGQIRPTMRIQLVSTPTVSGPWMSIYRAVEGVEQQWLAWSRDVDVLQLPLAPTLERRWAWSGDGEPRHARFADLPNAPLALGIPRPQAELAVSHSGGSGAAVTRVYVYTFLSRWKEESQDSPALAASALVTGRVDGTWSISGMDAAPANSGTGTATHAGGVTTFTNSGNHWLRAGDEVTISATRVAVSEVVTNSVFRVPGNFAGATSWSRVAPWNTTGMTRRLYRSAGSSGRFQLVADNVGTSFSDTLTDAQIPGDELISSDWAPPPAGLRGLRAHPSGALVGFVGQTLCFSEPMQPHAWPPRFQRTLAHQIVGIEVYGTTVVVATEATPYLVTGSTPASISIDQINEPWPCLSKRGVVAVEDGVLYPSAHGLAHVSQRGGVLWTQHLYEREGWRKLQPQLMVAAVSEGRVYARHGLSADFDRGTLVFSPGEREASLTRLDLWPDALFSDPHNGRLYLSNAQGIFEFAADDGQRLTYTWRSGEYVLPRPVNFGAAVVDFVAEMSDAEVAAALSARSAAEADNQNAVTNNRGQGSINGSRLLRRAINASPVVPLPPLVVAAVNVAVHAGDRMVYSALLAEPRSLLRLPSGHKSDRWTVELTGSVWLRSFKMAETATALNRL
ncbi:MAG TPA: hypothetical protein DCM32_08080 [Xanthomonadaceae bacterium]|nr:hypothetical protein [Xanthomonadaceae bacterium]